jgi:hypothetical protein
MFIPEETYIVRVRTAEGDAVIEDVRSRRRLYVSDLTSIGVLISGLVATTRDLTDASASALADASHQPQGGNR